MKWQIVSIAAVVALFQYSGQAAEAHCHHHRWAMMNGMNGYNTMGMSAYNPMAMSGYGRYNNGYGAYNTGYGGYNPYSGYNRNMMGYGGGMGSMMNTGVMGRLIRGF